MKRFIFFHGKKHPSAMGSAEINAYLTHLAVHRHVSASTQSQALAAILFLYRDVLGEEVREPTFGARSNAEVHTEAGKRDAVLLLIHKATQK